MLLIKNATILAPTSRLHGKKRDILIRKGIIDKIQAKISVDRIKTWDVKGAFVSIGWFDIGVQVGDPGFEHREDLQTAAKAAMAGGYTAMACYPNTSPIMHSKSEVLYLKNNTSDELVDFFPIGAVSKNCEGADITEMYDMRKSGAVAFSDGNHSIQHSGLMLRALQYAKGFEGTVINHPLEKSISGNGIVHEGTISTSLGMKGIPRIAEEIMVQRDVYLAEYAQSKVHIANISTARSVELIRQAKAKNVAVTASVPAMNLAFDTQNLTNFDSQYKVMPPLREQSDIKALIQGLKDGTIDCISSNHTPLEEEAKMLEFPYADFGTIGLETTFALCNTYLKDDLTTEEIIEKIAINPRNILGIQLPQIEEGQEAQLTIFDPNHEWTFQQKDIQSKSKNTPLIGATLVGKVLGVVNNRQFAISES